FVELQPGAFSCPARCNRSLPLWLSPAGVPHAPLPLCSTSPDDDACTISMENARPLHRLIPTLIQEISNRVDSIIKTAAPQPWLLPVRRVTVDDHLRARPPRHRMAAARSRDVTRWRAANAANPVAPRRLKAARTSAHE